ncbi:MAG TPA: hypothetical protein VFE98_03465 [Candidatus Bathyarchaeia archaeon]|nr:hypothetical protein [Candidatus Bathyarchaeia archaeon]
MTLLAVTMKKASGHLSEIRLLADPYPDTGETGDTYDIELACLLEGFKARFVKTLQPPTSVLLVPARTVK